MLEEVHVSNFVGIFLDPGLPRGSHIYEAAPPLSSGILVLGLWLNITLGRYIEGILSLNLSPLNLRLVIGGRGGNFADYMFQCVFKHQNHGFRLISQNNPRESYRLF